MFELLNFNLSGSTINCVEINEVDEDDDDANSVASSSPFELCEITDVVQIEAPPNSEKSDDSKKAFKTEPKHVEKETKTGMHINLLKSRSQDTDPGNLTLLPLLTLI